MARNAASHGTTEVVSGNVLGANTALLLLVLGIVSAVSKRGIHLGERYIAIDLNFMVGAAALIASQCASSARAASAQAAWAAIGARPAVSSPAAIGSPQKTQAGSSAAGMRTS